MERKQAQILGYNVDLFNFQEALDYTMYLLSSDYDAQIITINPEMIEFAQKNEDFSNMINSAELVIPDGMGIKIALGLNGYNQGRIPGVEFAKKMLELCAQKNIPVGMIGSTKQVIQKAVDNLKAELPNLNIVYVRDGFFEPEEMPQISEDIKTGGAKFILVALGSPKQEFFIYDCRKVIPNAVWIGVGGSFDVWSGVVKRAPVIFRKLGLEWLYRVIDNPKRISRIFPTLPIFLGRVIMDKVALNKKVKNG